jgi:streptomycin 6-kinase
VIHPGLAWLEGSPEGRAWLERLPRLRDECAETWSLELGEPFAYAFASLSIPAMRAEGTDVVLKLQFPDRESEHEAAALRAWDGGGAVRLLEHDRERHALLLERCLPGTSLAEVEPEAALDVAVGLLPRLWIPTGDGFRSLADEAAWWAGYLPGRWRTAGEPFERELLDAALDAIRALSASQPEQVLVNQDLHADNILRGEREPWLVIDPKPLVGERAFGVVPLVRGSELGHSREAVIYRLDRLSGALGLDRDRVRGWTIAQTLAWGLDEDGAVPDHVEVARWLFEETSPARPNPHRRVR